MVYKSNPERKAVKEKIAKVKDTIEEMKNYKTVALVSLEKLPDSLLQFLRKKIREGGGKVKILRKAVITRVLESNSMLKEKISECERPVALILTNWTPYELNKFLKENKKKRAAKAGETAPSEIVVPEGETDLPPGPALSELKAGGVNVQIKGGKIVVAKDSVVAKAGDRITGPKAKALQTLGVMPFETRAQLVFGFDGEYSYSSDLLNMGDTINSDLRESLGEAFNFSVNADYPTSLNAEHLLQEAFRQALNTAVNGELYSIVTMDELLLRALREGKALSDVSPEEAPKEEAKPEEKKEEPKAEEKKEEKPKEEPKKEEAPKPKEKPEEAKPEKKPKEEPKEKPKEEKPSEKKKEKPAKEEKPKKAPKAEKKEDVKKE
jgi:large subunit ribosomal protein L10